MSGENSRDFAENYSSTTFWKGGARGLTKIISVGWDTYHHFTYSWTKQHDIRLDLLGPAAVGEPNRAGPGPLKMYS